MAVLGLDKTKPDGWRKAGVGAGSAAWRCARGRGSLVLVGLPCNGGPGREAEGGGKEGGEGASSKSQRTTVVSRSSKTELCLTVLCYDLTLLSWGCVASLFLPLLALDARVYMLGLWSAIAIYAVVDSSWRSHHHPLACLVLMPAWSCDFFFPPSGIRLCVLGVAGAFAHSDESRLPARLGSILQFPSGQKYIKCSAMINSHLPCRVSDGTFSSPVAHGLYIARQRGHNTAQEI